MFFINKKEFTVTNTVIKVIPSILRYFVFCILNSEFLMTKTNASIENGTRYSCILLASKVYPKKKIATEKKKKLFLDNFLFFIKMRRVADK